MFLFLLRFYHAALFSHGITPLRAVSATRLTPDTSVHTVCCIITQEGSTFPKGNVFFIRSTG